MDRDLRIAFVGDSFVNGTGDPAFLGWTGRLCARSRTLAPGLTRYELGIRRQTSRDIEQRWQHEVLPRLPTGCDRRVVFSCGANDTDEVAGGLAPSASLAAFSALVGAARALMPVLVVGPPALSEAHDSARNARIAALSAGFAGICATLAVPYLEVAITLRTHPAWQEEVTRGDGAHPQEAGYELLAQLVFAWRAWQDWLLERGTY
jgi:acyl-CoA thioesterase-1